LIIFEKLSFVKKDQLRVMAWEVLYAALYLFVSFLFLYGNHSFW